MRTRITGTISSIFPDDINTDDMIPAWTLQESSERTFFKQYAFANYDPNFIKQCERFDQNIIVAGKNFGCGSSREQAVYALQENNVTAVIAESFPDIFYRNALNNGLILIVLSEEFNVELGDKMLIDLENKFIEKNNKKILFQMSPQDAKTFTMGGKIARVRTHLEEILTKKISTKKYLGVQKRSKTIAEKIISHHIGRSVTAGEKIDQIPIDILFFNEVIGPPAIKDFISLTSDIFKKYCKKVHPFDPKKIFFIPDHTVPSSSVAVSDGITLMEEFSKAHGIRCYKEGDGIEHVVLIEDGHIIPGNIILGTDSHTDTNGAFNTMAFGIGTTDAIYAMTTGYLYDFEVPKTIRVNLTGKFPKGVYSKDLILSLIGRMGVDGASRKVVEFGGSTLKNLSMDARTTIANMVVEMGARTGIFEYDDVLAQYLRGKTRSSFEPVFPDRGCTYERVIEIDLSSCEPVVAFPHKPSNTTNVSQMKQFMKKSQKSTHVDFAPVTSLQITDAFLGACTNGRYEDFIEAAKILKGKKVHPKVNFIAIPASRKTYNRLMKEGVLQIFAYAGANIESSNCGPCFGKHMGVVGRGAQMISSSNRNYLGRMGSKDAKIFLASPATVTAAAIAGEIVDPRKYL